MKNKILIIFGTRPEFIKLLPLILELKKNKKNFLVLNTGQHKELINDQFKISKNLKIRKLNLIKKKTNLSISLANIVKGVSYEIIKIKPSLIVVQGDTSTALGGAISGHLNNIKVAHIEAGLRTFDRLNPFPEETNRVLISKIADYHFAPTQISFQNLIKEGIKKNIFLTGNTIVDAIKLFKNKIKKNKIKQKIVFCTIHRRENFGKNLKKICFNINYLVKKYSDYLFFITVHPNPNIKNNLFRFLIKNENLKLIKPLDFFTSLNFQFNASAIITDSGGIQEESATLGKYLLVTRKITERQEAVSTGNCFLVNTDIKKFKKFFSFVLKKNKIQNHINLKNIFGDGFASKRIFKIIKQYG